MTRFFFSLFLISRKRHQNEHARIPLRSPYTEPSSPYIQRCRPAQATRQPAYHKPVREHPHHPNSLPDLPSKPRGNGRKLRVHHSPQNCAPVHPAENCAAQGGAQTVSQNLTTSPTQNINLNLSNTHAGANNQNQNHSNNHGNPHPNNQRNEAHIHPPHSGGKPGKKHQLKHATREQDQARAMAQVVRWLEREFSQGAAAAAGRRHVHEHIHHHYHHYHAEALV